MERNAHRQALEAKRGEGLRPFQVQIKRGAQVVHEYTAMGQDSMSVAAEQQALCTDGEYVRVDASSGDSLERAVNERRGWL